MLSKKKKIATSILRQNLKITYKWIKKNIMNITVFNEFISENMLYSTLKLQFTLQNQRLWVAKCITLWLCNKSL